MSAFETATKLFHACEKLEGWEGCKEYVADGATYSGHCEPLMDVKTVEEYCEWMAGIGKGPLKGCSYIVNSASYDEANKVAMFFGTITGTHVGEGGPVPPTNKETVTDYVYAFTMNDAGKVAKMRKIWNASWTLKELGWM
ncbi:MAG: hypothetical protein CFH38_00463 [Alphaproteobacteria bacterium MarineAlpha10_Bin1]|jgi:hypothetical protein|nr:MAG: hypothetical protein CFH38_00463 [Alphaproteobacteria bacterium MarineAlpha10_Bin1]|tara:strand:+ start:341 stop:760 length:420 start_codon:yes stop_codon:yes gene_type:complete